MDSDNLTQYFGKRFTATIDRPIGSRHPDWGFEYRLNYGFIAGMPAPDGEDQDVYVMGVEHPIRSFTGVCVAVIMRADDVEGKLVLAADGITYSRKQITQAIAFQEQYFDSRVILPGDRV